MKLTPKKVQGEEFRGIAKEEEEWTTVHVQTASLTFTTTRRRHCCWRINFTQAAVVAAEVVLVSPRSSTCAVWLLILQTLLATLSVALWDPLKYLRPARQTRSDGTIHFVSYIVE